MLLHYMCDSSKLNIKFVKSVFTLFYDIRKAMQLIKLSKMHQSAVCNKSVC
jgi:ribosomal protein L30/L7E